MPVKALLNVGIVPWLGARAPSPATSIAETVASATQDLQSQQELLESGVT
jgi:hypothetical protein